MKATSRVEVTAVLSGEEANAVAAVLLLQFKQPKVHPTAGEMAMAREFAELLVNELASE